MKEKIAWAVIQSLKISGNGWRLLDDTTTSERCNHLSHRVDFQEIYIFALST